MSEWIRPTRYFSSRAALLTLVRDQASTLGVLDGQDDPDKLEAAALRLIAMYRPEMVGGIVQGIRFDFTRFQFQILYEHPSLPRVSEGSMFPEMPLIPEESGFVVES